MITLWSARGEFTVVKHGYAAGRTGWFSDRSACYLAAGRPVICQDTGIGEYVPTGAGLLTFTDLDSAVDAISRVEQGYAQHAAAASAFAREYLDSDRVLTTTPTIGRNMTARSRIVLSGYLARYPLGGYTWQVAH